APGRSSPPAPAPPRWRSRPAILSSPISGCSAGFPPASAPDPTGSTAMTAQHPGADSFDYVIIGSGAAGSVLANRLTEDGTTTVCVLEAGPPDRNPFIHIPAGFIKTLADPGVTWQ